MSQSIIRLFSCLLRWPLLPFRWILYVYRKGKNSKGSLHSKGNGPAVKEDSLSGHTNIKCVEFWYPWHNGEKLMSHSLPTMMTTCI